MVNGNSTASEIRPVEGLAPDTSASHIAAAQNAGQSFRAGLRRRRASGIFRSTEQTSDSPRLVEFAGLERLDRAELDETDED